MRERLLKGSLGSLSAAFASIWWLFCCWTLCWWWRMCCCCRTTSSNRSALLLPAFFFFSIKNLEFTWRTLGRWNHRGNTWENKKDEVSESERERREQPRERATWRATGWGATVGQKLIYTTCYLFPSTFCAQGGGRGRFPPSFVRLSLSLSLLCQLARHSWFFAFSFLGLVVALIDFFISKSKTLLMTTYYWFFLFFLFSFAALRPALTARGN